MKTTGNVLSLQAKIMSFPILTQVRQRYFAKYMKG